MPVVIRAILILALADDDNQRHERTLRADTSVGTRRGHQYDPDTDSMNIKVRVCGAGHASRVPERGGSAGYRGVPRGQENQLPPGERQVVDTAETSLQAEGHERPAGAGCRDNAGLATGARAKYVLKRAALVKTVQVRACL